MDIKRINGKYDTVFRAESPIGVNAMVENFDNCLVTLSVKAERADDIEEALKKLGLEVSK